MPRTKLHRHAFTSSLALLSLLPAQALAAPWEIDPGVQLPENSYTTRSLELVDIDGDGDVDILFANSSSNANGNIFSAELNQLLRHDPGPTFTELSGVFEGIDNAHAIKAGDLDGDGDPDLVVGVNFNALSYVLRNDGGSFSKQDLPGPDHSIGDLELGDVDGDGDLDILATDWGNGVHGDPDDKGAPLVLWLGDGDGGFAEAGGNVPTDMASWAAWSFDIELVDLDNDFDLDAMVSTRGTGTALVFQNDGTGVFVNYPVPALQPIPEKAVNTAFTPIDVDGDDFVDVITLQDGPAGGGACIMIDGVQYCSKRDSVLINDTMGKFLDNPGPYWDLAINPPKLDFDAATLDFNNDGRADFVATGLRLGGMDNNSRLMLNSGTKFTPAPMPSDAAFPIDPELAHSFGLMFADLDGDRREDVAVVSRYEYVPNYVLFGRDDPNDGVPEDDTGPRFGLAEQLPDVLYFGQTAQARLRVHDSKTPTHWHDYQYDPMLPTYNLVGPGAAAQVHRRRIPYIEFALGLANPDDLATLADDDPAKFIAPGVWYGEALWRVSFQVPYGGMKDDTLTWRRCAIDAAGNQTCIGPFTVQLMPDPGDCGNGMVEPWETCDDGGPLCILCETTCGDMTCGPGESTMNCPGDCPCDGDGACDPGEAQEFCADCADVTETTSGTSGDLTSGGLTSDDPGDCGDGVCAPGESASCPQDCPSCGDDICSPPAEDAQTCAQDCVVECPGGAPTKDGNCQFEDESACRCLAQPRAPSAATLLLLGLAGVGLRRRRAPGLSTRARSRRT